MKECLELFRFIIRSPWFRSCKIVVLWSKVDHLANMLSRYPIKTWWPCYDRPSQSDADVIEFFTDKFLSCNINKERHIVVKTINLIDTKGVHRFIQDELLS